jgi:hypothetical protein
MKERQRGIVVTVDGKEVKIVPKKYEKFVYDTSFIDDPDHKRLTQTERLELENRLWINSFSWDERYSQSMIRDHEIKKVYLVYNRFGDTDFEALYDNGIQVRIPMRLYNMAPVYMRERKNSL